MIQTREREIEVVRLRLIREGTPRLQMSFILLLTGLAGFLASFSLLHLGVASMALRYPAAIVMAYCVFLLLLRLWLWAQGRGLHADLDPSCLDIDIPGGSAPGKGLGFGGGGDFAGSGAGGNWGAGVASPSRAPGGDSFLDRVGFDLDLEEGWLVVLALVALVGGLLASLYVIYIAPALLAEILVDGVLLAGLYKRVKRIEQRYWLRSALRRTLTPAVLTAALFTAGGYLMQRAVPAALSIGDVWKHLAGG